MSAAPPTTQVYYDRFAPNYERERHHGYHRLIDELESTLIERYARDADVLEAGCGTGLLLRQTQQIARSCVGLDLSRGMLQAAARRGLAVVQGTLERLPWPDRSFDLVYSMKVLAHVPDITGALAELARVVRPGGHMLLEFYNPYSLRYLAKRLGSPAPIADGTTDHDVFTRYDTLAAATSYLPEGTQLVTTRGVRIFTPTSAVFRSKSLGALFSLAEKRACDLPLVRNLGGFLILVVRKN